MSDRLLKSSIEFVVLYTVVCLVVLPKLSASTHASWRTNSLFVVSAFIVIDIVMLFGKQAENTVYAVDTSMKAALTFPVLLDDFSLAHSHFLSFSECLDDVEIRNVDAVCMRM